MPYDFYPRSPCGERPPRCRQHLRALRFLSTLSLRRATVGQKRFLQKLAISIHALLAESDANAVDQILPGHISIHALLAESDVMHALIFADPVLFLSTLSLRRATFASAGRLQIVYNFYPRSPCGERLRRGDRGARQPGFLSTLSLRRATRSGRLL